MCAVLVVFAGVVVCDCCVVCVVVVCVCSGVCGCCACLWLLWFLCVGGGVAVCVLCCV